MEATKSIKSKNPLFAIFSSGTKPRDSNDGILSRKISVASIIADFFLDHPQRSIVKATGTSSKDTVEVRAAMASSTKNNPPNKEPSGMAENAAGSATNTSPGPCPASIPKEKVVGKIMRPAINA
ncbi:hypothetical protein D3C81_1903390 [compost metagenome]